MSTYTVKQPTIAVFENTYRSADNHPVKNVVVTFPDGTKFEGGLWEKQSKSGLEYLSGVLKPAEDKGSNQYERKIPTRSKPAEQEVDFG
jgi:uncharacterized protein (DUF736 family)